MTKQFNMLNVMDYAYVVNSKKLKDSGLEVGQILMVSAIKPAPVKKSDPYLQRIYVLCAKVDEEGVHQIPTEDNDYSMYLVDPRSLQKVGEEETAELLKALHEQFKHDTTD